MRPNEFKRHRDRLGMTQEELAKAIGVHWMTVSKWERGTHRIPEPVALLLAQMRPQKGGKAQKRH